MRLCILGDPGAVSRVGRKGGMKVFKYGQKSPWVPTLTELFPKIQADASSWLGTKNALYYCAQSANSFSWVLFVSLYTTAIARFVHQACACKGNFYFLLSWLETKELPMSRKNVWDAISGSNSICLENILFFDGPQYIVNNRKFKMRRRRGSQISNSLIRQNNNFARASRFFVLFSARLSVKMHNFTFCEGRKQEMTKFILFMNLDNGYGW